MEEQGALRRIYRSIYKYKIVIAALSAFLIGILLLVNKEHFLNEELARDLAIAVITAATAGLVVEFYVRREFESLIGESLVLAINKSQLPEELKQIGVGLNEVKSQLSVGRELSELGFIRAHVGRPMNQFDDFIRQAAPNTEICLLGICLMGFSNSHMQALFLKKLEEGCTIRMLTLVANSSHVDQRAGQEKRSPDDLRSDIFYSDKIHTNFINHRVPLDIRNKKIFLTYYDADPSYFILFTNKVMIVGFYLLGARGEAFPHLELHVKGGGIYESFKKHFDLLEESGKRFPLASDSTNSPTAIPTALGAAASGGTPQATL
jgi:hypothetical protein